MLFPRPKFSQPFMPGDVVPPFPMALFVAIFRLNRPRFPYIHPAYLCFFSSFGLNSIHFARGINVARCEITLTWYARTRVKTQKICQWGLQTIKPFPFTSNYNETARFTTLSHRMECSWLTTSHCVIGSNEA